MTRAWPQNKEDGLPWIREVGCDFSVDEMCKLVEAGDIDPVREQVWAKRERLA